jgi:hypothetical protein
MAGSKERARGRLPALVDVLKRRPDAAFRLVAGAPFVSIGSERGWSYFANTNPAISAAAFRRIAGMARE